MVKGFTRKMFIAFIALGLVSLFADVTYEGARSVIGAYFNVLGASAIIVGSITVSDLVGYLVRGFSGFIAGFIKSSKLYWLLIYLGYSINMFAVPALAFTGNWELAFILVILERVGKGLRTPVRDVVLAEITEGFGKGKGFGLHEVMDQVGAFTGPLIVAYSLTVSGGDYRSCFFILIIPAVLALLSLTIAYTSYPSVKAVGEKRVSYRGFLTRRFWFYIVAVSVTSLGFIHWSLVAFYLKHTSVVADVYIPLLYTVAMFADAAIAFPAGYMYDKIGFKVLILTPLLLLSIPTLLFYSTNLLLVASIVWGFSMGLYETVMRVSIADLVKPVARAYAYGVYGICFGLSWTIGNVFIGYLYGISYTLVVLYISIVEIIAFTLLSILAMKR